MKTKVFIWWKGKTRGSGKGLVLTRQHEECRVLVRYEGFTLFGFEGATEHRSFEEERNLEKVPGEEGF